MNKLMIALLLACPLFAQANPGFNLQEVSCSGELVATEGALQCGGDLAFTDNGSSSGAAILLAAADLPSLENSNIQVPRLALHGSGVIMMQDKSTAETRSVSILERVDFGGNLSLIESRPFTLGQYLPSHNFDITQAGTITYLDLDPLEVSQAGMVWNGFVLLPVPEPSTYSTMLLGLLALAFAVRRSCRD